MTSSNDWDSGSSTPSSTDPATYENHNLGTGDSTPAKERAQQVAGTAKEEGAHVADTARSEAQQVAGEAKEKAADLLAEAKTQIGEQSKTQLDALVSKLDELRHEVDSMVEGNPMQGMVTDLARQLSDKTRSLSSHLRDRDPKDLVEDVRGFARQRPGTFLIGAVTAGVLAGRLTRGAKQAHDADQGSGTTSNGTGTSSSSASGASVPTPPPTYVAEPAEPSIGAGYRDDLGTDPLGSDVPSGQNMGGRP